MVCNRCIHVVEQELTAAGLPPKKVQLGEVEFEHKIKAKEKAKIAAILEPFGFEVLEDKKSRLIEQIKSTIIQTVQNLEGDPMHNLSDILSRELNHDYNYLSNLFSQVEGTTIEKYFIAQKIEKVKELLVYDELSLSEIAYRLNYSSVAYLSNQFKRVTGLTPTHFRQVKGNRRKPLDNV